MPPTDLSRRSVLRGAATALAALPVVSAAYAVIRPDQLPDAASVVNIVQRVGGSIGAAGLAVVLVRSQAAGLPVDAGFELTFRWLTAVAVLASITSIILWRRESQSRHATGSQVLASRKGQP